MQKDNLFTFGSLFLFSAVSCFSCNDGDKEYNKPNILIILADDMGFSDLGCYGSEISTPNLDGIAAEGFRFTRMHNTSKSFPSRACLLTGRYAQNCNMAEKPGEMKNAFTIGEIMRTAGYRTYMVGKHHGTENPWERGFDRYFGLRDGTCNYFNPGEQREGEPVPAHKIWAKPRHWCIDSMQYAPYTPPEKDFYTTDYFTNYALEFLESGKDDSSPFLLYAAYNAPHDPLHAWTSDIEKYLGRYMNGYEYTRQKRYKKQLETGLLDEAYPLSEPGYTNWSELSYEERLTEDSLMATYAAMIDRLDQNIGRIISWLKENGEYENTVIFFMSDNGCQPGGPPDSELNSTARKYPIGSMGRYSSISKSWANVGNTPFRYYKNWSHEGGTCTPFIFSWPAMNKFFSDEVLEFPLHFIDLMPTLMEIGGVNYPEGSYNDVDGISLIPVLRGDLNKRPDPLFWEWSQGKAMSDGEYKIVSGNNGPWELYNLKDDKTETCNLADKEPDRIRELSEMWSLWKKGTGN